MFNLSRLLFQGESPKSLYMFNGKHKLFPISLKLYLSAVKHLKFSVAKGGAGCTVEFISFSCF